MLQARDKLGRLEELYSRITRIAGAMGGTAFRTVLRLSFPAEKVAAPRSEGTPALVAKMPDNFGVVFAPTFPLSVMSALLVRARRTHAGLLESDWHCNFGPDGWRRTQAPLSDDEIRACLTTDGTMPAVH